MDKKITPLPWAEDGDRITTQSGRLLASVWSRRVPDDQQPGESWLAMRERTQPERDAAQAEMHANAAFIVKAVNSHKQLKACLELCLERIIEECTDPDHLEEVILARAALARLEGK